jgi:hypothetical protein
MLLAFFGGGVSLGILAAFLMLGAWAGYGRANLYERMDAAPRRQQVVCPTCGSSPPVGDFWRCARCLTWFELFAPPEPCAKGGQHLIHESCLECGRALAAHEWQTRPVEESEARQVNPWYAASSLRSVLKQAFPRLGEDPQQDAPYITEIAESLKANHCTEEAAFALFAGNAWRACHGDASAAAEAFVQFPAIVSHPTARSVVCWLEPLVPFPEKWNPAIDSAAMAGWIRERLDRLIWREAESRFVLEAGPA